MRRFRVILLLSFMMLVVAGGLLVVHQFTTRAIDAVDRRFGDWFYILGAVVIFIAFSAVVIAGSASIAVWMWNRGRQIHAKDGLYPKMARGRGQYDDLNERGAQSLSAVTAAGKRPTAAMAGRVIESHYSQLLPAPETPLALPEPEGIDVSAPLPSHVSVYTSPLPRELSLPVGVDAYGQPVCLSLRNRGNILIGGDPGFGKSELVGTMIAGLLRQDPNGQRIRISVADLKLLDFGNMPLLPAMPEPVAVETEAAFEMVQRLRDETEERFATLMDARARSLDEYYQRTGRIMPHHIAFLDEFADLTYNDDGRFSKEFIAILMKIARKGRAAGVTLVMATQRPTSDVIPSSVRGLATTKIALRVARGESSSAILDMRGAERLPLQPGRCIVIDGQAKVVQAYASGLESGQFDRFLDSLPQVGQRPSIPLKPPEPAIPLVPEPPEPIQIASASGIPVFRTDDDPEQPYSPEQEAHILRLYEQTGKLKEVQRRLYDGQQGGHWFYRIRAVVHAAGYDTSPRHARRRISRGNH